jgi:PST family polysaccharide transporter
MSGKMSTGTASAEELSTIAEPSAMTGGVAAQGSEHTSTPLAQQALSGLNWQLLANVIRFGAQWGISVVLARLLPPEDFGIVALAYIATGFASLLTNLGLGPALIQREDVTERHIRVCHTITVIMAVLTSAIIFAASGAIANFVRDARVESVLQILSITFLLSGFSVTAGALLSRQLAFHITVKIELVASIIGYGGVAVGMAALGYGYWSLVGGTLAQAFLSSVLTVFAARHSLSPLLGRREVRDLLGFSSGVTVVRVINYFALQGDYFVIGRMMSAASVGFYSRAYALMQLPQTFLGMALTRVLFPAAARVQADGDRFRRAYLSTFSLSVAISLPISLGMVVLAPELVLTLYGDSWTQTVPLLQILGLFGVFRMGYNNVTAFIHARGRTLGLAASQVAYALLVVGGSWWAISHWGLEGAAWAVGGAVFTMWVLVVRMANRVAGVPTRQLLRVCGKAALLPAILGVGLHGLAIALRALTDSPILVLLGAGGVYGIAATAALWRHVRGLGHPASNAYLDRIHQKLASRLAPFRKHVSTGAAL